MRALAVFGLATMLAGPASALDLSLPAAARRTAERNTGPDRYAAPVGVYADANVARIHVEGTVRRAAWRLDATGLTPLQVIRPLRQQLEDAGFEIVLDCASAECGGFDFRFRTEVLPGPNMYVNIRSYHFVTALRRGEDGAPVQVITLLASAAATSAYLQIVQAGDLAESTATIETDAPLPVTVPRHAGSDALTAQLLQQGHAVLPGLDFDTGTTDLGRGPFPVLTTLAAFLKANPTLRVALVGHTDSTGALDINIGISRRRAQSVRQRLIDAHDIPPDQMDAEGMGYLSPVAPNLTEAGREQNRRVEVVVLSTQ